MSRLIPILTLLLTFVFTIPNYGQADSSCNAVRVLKNGSLFKERKRMNTFSKNGFFLYKNFLYNLEFYDDVKIFGRIIDILNDSIYITNSFNNSIATRKNINFDTLKYSIKQIKTLHLTTERIFGYTREIKLRNYTLTMVKNPCCTDTSRAIIRTESIDFSKSDTLLHSKKIIIKLNTSGTRTDKEMTTICYPYLTNNGIALIYELEGLLYFVGLNSPGE